MPVSQLSPPVPLAAMSNRKPRVVRYARKGHCGRMVDAIKAGEPVNSVDKEWRSALFHAALQGNKKCVKELIRRGGDPNLRSRNGYTACHAAALGGKSPRFPSEEITSTRNPFRGAWLLTRGAYNVLKYYLRDRQRYCRCLEYLTVCGGDLRAQSLSRETVRDIAVRMRKMKIVEFIEEFYDLQTSQSGYSVRKGQSMLRPNSSYPHSCPRWMHGAVQSGASLENMSPLTSEASVFHGRTRNVFDYGYVYPFGGRLSPGATSNVPEVMPLELHKSPQHYCIAEDGSVFGRGLWQEQAVTYRSLRCQESSMTVDHMLKEMEALALLRHPNFPLLMAVCCGPAKNNVFALLEPLHWIPLHTVLHQQRSQEFGREVISGVASALVYLHTIQQAAHCLLSSHSVLLTDGGRPKLVNLFCLTADGNSIGKLAHFKLYVPWMAPELLQTQVAHTCCDMYSLGVLVWEMWGGEHPWAGVPLPEVYRLVVRAGERLALSGHHREVSRLINKCFQPPERRPCMDTIIHYINKLGDRPHLSGNGTHPLHSASRASHTPQ